MFNVCPACGEYSEEKAIDPAGPFAICPHCGHRHRFLRLPMFVITGASGSGKTTICMLLAARMSACIFMESDILCRLRARPGWRKSADIAFVERMVTWNRWLKKHAGDTTPPITLLDNTSLTLEQSVADVQRWITARLEASPALS